MSAFPISAALLDAMVLALVQKEDTSGYKFTREIQAVISISESTLYPVLRRLQKEQFLVTYDRAYLGRNRRYYQITEAGRQALSQYRTDWNQYKQQIDSFLKEETT